MLNNNEKLWWMSPNKSKPKLALYSWQSLEDFNHWSKSVNYRLNQNVNYLTTKENKAGTEQLKNLGAFYGLFTSKW